MFTKTSFIVAILATISFASATVVQNCVAGDEPIFVEIAGCDVEPCQLINTADMLITFRVLNDSYTLVPKVRAKVGPLTITYPLGGDLADGCNSLKNGYCPLEKGEVLIYHLSMPVSDFPKIAVTLEFSLLGDGGVVFQCFRVDCKVD